MEGNGALHTVPNNPGSVSVKRGDGSLDIICKKDGYKQLNTMVGDSFNGTTVVNILYWPGFLVDAATGAYKKFPTHYVVNMEKIKVEKK